MSNADRRLHVRTKPTADLPANAVVVGQGLVSESLTVVDIGVGGVALSAPQHASVGQQLQLRLTLGNVEYLVTGVVRWIAEDVAGVEFVELSPASAAAVGRYVSELLERGSHA